MVSTAKSPMDMFDTDMVDNDLKAIDKIIREYYDMPALVDEPKTKSKK